MSFEGPKEELIEVLPLSSETRGEDTNINEKGHRH